MEVQISCEGTTAQTDIQQWLRCCCGHCSSINWGDMKRLRNKMYIRLLSPSGWINFQFLFLHHLWHLGNHLKFPSDIRHWTKHLWYHLLFHKCMQVCILYFFYLEQGCVKVQRSNVLSLVIYVFLQAGL